MHRDVHSSVCEGNNGDYCLVIESPLFILNSAILQLLKNKKDPQTSII